MPVRVSALVLVTAGALACLPGAPLPLRWLGAEHTNDAGIRMVRIPAGELLMGPPNDGDEASPRQPSHRVRISRAFYMGVHEVTQTQYEKVMGKNPSWFHKGTDGRERVRGVDTSRFPVEMVSWHEAMEFCQRLTEMPGGRGSGRVYRLPTEAEWEYACRAGATEYSRYAFGKSITGKANHSCDSASAGRPVPVGSYPANAWGLHDMHGNVAEWCLDWFGETYYRDSPKDDPPGPKTGKWRVVRGGDYSTYAWGCRSVNRSAQPPDWRSQGLGFRVVMVPGR